MTSHLCFIALGAALIVFGQFWWRIRRPSALPPPPPADPCRECRAMKVQGVGGDIDCERIIEGILADAILAAMDKDGLVSPDAVTQRILRRAVRMGFVRGMDFERSEPDTSNNDSSFYRENQ